jgi:TPR repeat protein
LFEDIEALRMSAEDILRFSAIAVEMEESGNVDDAILMYKIGATLGELTCMTRLADILSEPPNYKNVSVAKALYERACVAGHAPACRNLAILYEQLGDSVRHERYMRLAKTRGDVWQNDN